MNIVNIKDYQEENINLKIFLYSTVVGLFIVIILVFLNIMNKNLYYEGELQVIDHKIVLINVLKEDLNTFINNNKIIINNQEYYYSINNLELYNNYFWYYELKLNINKELLINSFHDYKILIKKETFFNYIIRIIKGK